MTALIPHCDAGLPSITCAYANPSHGKDWHIDCPCGFSKEYPWVGKGFAIACWNEDRLKEKDDDDTIRAC